MVVELVAYSIGNVFNHHCLLFIHGIVGRSSNLELSRIFGFSQPPTQKERTLSSLPSTDQENACSLLQELERRREMHVMTRRSDLGNLLKISEVGVAGTKIFGIRQYSFVATHGCAFLPSLLLSSHLNHD